MRLGKIIAIVISISFNLSLFAQHFGDISFAKTIQRVAPNTDQYDSQISVDNELQMIIGALFIGYKKLVSSQDSQNCGFHPSCSVFAVQAMREKGLISGYFLAFDRITRCHEFSRGRYPINEENGLKIDETSGY